MTQRHSGYMIVMENDVREDDAQSTIDAIKHIKGVIDVVPFEGDGMLAIATVRAKADMLGKIYDFLKRLQ